MGVRAIASNRTACAGQQPRTPPPEHSIRRSPAPQNPGRQDVQESRVVGAASRNPGLCRGIQKEQTTGLHPLTLQGRQQHVSPAWAQAGGAGIQPGGPGGDRTEVPEEGLVQDPAASADRGRGGLPQPDGHQPLLLWPVQLLLHPAAHQEGAGSFPVLRLLPTAQVHHADGGAGLPRPAASIPAPENPEGQTVPVHLGPRGGVWQAVMPGDPDEGPAQTGLRISS